MAAATLDRLWDSLTLLAADPGVPVFTADVPTQLGALTVGNVDTVAHTVMSFIVLAGQGAALDDAEWVETVRVEPGDTAFLEKTERHVLRTGDMLFQQADADDVLVSHGSGVKAM